MNVISLVDKPDEILFVNEGLIIVVFEWARGKALNYMEERWMKDKAVISAWGSYFAQLHKLSKRF